MKSKKGMAIGQVFVFIVAAITFALIMIFGYKAITDFLGKGEQVEFYSFKTELESSVKKIYTEYGSVRLKEFNLPGKYEEICFVDMDKSYGNVYLNDDCDFDVYGCDVWKTISEQGLDWEETDENVFLKPIAPIKIRVFRIEIGDGDGEGVLCVPVEKGKFKLKLEGRGDKTRISEAPES